MSLAIRVEETTPAAEGELVCVNLAAVLMGITASAVHKHCDREWFEQGKARKEDGRVLVNRSADPRLRPPGYLKQRDLEQLAAAAGAGVKPKFLEIAKAQKRCLDAWDRVDKRPSVDVAFGRCMAALLAEGGILEVLGAAPSMKSVYRWQRRYELGGIEALMPKSHKSGRGRWAETGAKAIERLKHYMLSGNSIKFAAAYILVAGEASPEHRGDPEWHLPSEAMAHRDLAPHKPEIAIRLANKGERAECVPKMERDFESIAAGDEYVCDNRRLDLGCRVKTSGGWRAVRPWLTAIEDMRTRMIVGWVLRPYANSRTILGSVKLAVRQHGKPVILRTDWGEDYRKAARHGELKDFRGEYIGGILDDLGIEVRKVAPYTPYDKPIESFFRGMKEHLDKLYIAFWGGCPSERHEDRARYLKENLEKLPTLEDVSAAIAKFLECYHNTPHSAADLFGKTPLEAMDAFRNGPVRKETDAVLDHLFKEFIGPKLVHRDGIRHGGYWYGTGDVRLVAMQGKRVLLAIQPDDQGRAMVCDVRTRQPLFAVECLPIAGRTREQIQEFHRAQRNLVKPFRESAKAARTYFESKTPEDLLDYRLAGIRAVHGKRPIPKDAAAPQLRIRPELEESIERAGPAPSESIEDASKAVRTGTDDVEITVADLLADEGEDLQTAPADVDAEDAADLDFFGLDDPEEPS